MASTNKRRSAFLPYRPPAHSTVLTNLQRGNTEATFSGDVPTLSFHERAGMNEISEVEATAVDAKDTYGFTPLHWACYYGQLSAAQLLLDAGASINIEAPEMVTPLHLAASCGHNEVVRLLLERGADIRHMDIMGNTALMYAAAGNHPHTCNEILSKDPDLTASNEDGDTAYSLALSNGALLSQAILEQYLVTLISLHQHSLEYLK